MLGVYIFSMKVFHVFQFFKMYREKYRCIRQELWNSCELNSCRDWPFLGRNVYLHPFITNRYAKVEFFNYIEKLTRKDKAYTTLFCAH